MKQKRTIKENFKIYKNLIFGTYKFCPLCDNTAIESYTHYRCSKCSFGN